MKQAVQIAVLGAWINVATGAQAVPSVQVVLPEVGADATKVVVEPFVSQKSAQRAATTSLDQKVIEQKSMQAEYDSDGKLKRPDNMDDWVFLGTTLGMTYIPGQRDADDPGYFSTVVMEPSAYRYFRETGKFMDGTMFAKIIYESELGEGGVSMGEQIYLEMHVKDRGRYPETGSGFFAWSPDDPAFAGSFPVDMGCVACHQAKASYDDVFTQFYPRIRKQAAAAKKQAE